MQRNGGFTGTSHPLDDQGFGVFVADDGVLVPLDGGHDVFHAVVGGTAQLVLKHVVDHVHGAVDHQLDLAVADTELAFEFDIASDLPFRGLIAGRTGFVVVEQ